NANDCLQAACSASHTCDYVPKPDATPCGVGGTCDANGQCNLCQPGAKACDGNVPTVCGSDGRFHSSAVCSGATPYCNPQTGDCVGCNSAADCPSASGECALAKCNNNSCENEPIPQG